MRNTDNHARNTAVQRVEGKVQLTPLFDFAPMYLDPELIPRALRWYRPDTRAELTDWTDVLAALPIPGHERRMLATELSRPYRLNACPIRWQRKGSITTSSSS